jgi:hypothetical protein
MEEKKKNMEFYNKVRAVPEEAKSTIGGGRLKGMTDINPMWRIKTLTENFGMCGIGWYFDITDKRIEEGANGEKVSIVDINLFVKQDGEWSKGIAGTGGSKLVTKESDGLYTSDECYKMALTDAISVACKNLGIGADVYYSKDRTKYDLEQTTKKVSLATKKQVEIIKEKLNEEQIGQALALVKREKLEDLTIQEASSLIKKIGGEK